ncbi:MAG: helix-turn-helix transcriptional regulator [Nitrospirae bacterium]|nr:helix-turn-helix transcriptional regulator [Nitrospirota bacterium]
MTFDTINVNISTYSIYVKIKSMNRFRHGHGKTTERQNLSQELLEARLLLILKKGHGHGYEIARSLENYGMGKKSPGAIYTLLNAMEERGLVVSKWDTSKNGPARRVYNITESGGLYLSTLAGHLGETIDVVASILAELGQHIVSKQ